MAYIHSSRETDLTFVEVLRTAALEDVREIEISGLDIEDVVALLTAPEYWLTTQSFAAGSDPDADADFGTPLWLNEVPFGRSDHTLVMIDDEL